MEQLSELEAEQRALEGVNEEYQDRIRELEQALQTKERTEKALRQE